MGRPSAKFSLLLSGLMVFQLVFPMVNALAADDSSTQPVATSEVSTSPEQPSETSPPAETPTDPQAAEPAPVKSTPAPESTKPAQTLATTTNTTVPAPTRLFYTALSPSDIKLEWTGVAGVKSYNIYTIAEDGTPTLFKDVKGAGTTYLVINGLPEGKTTFAVTAVSDAGESLSSNFLPLNIQYPTLLAPTSFTKTLRNINDIELSWAAVEHAQSYYVYQVLENGEQKLVSSALSTTTFKVLNVAAGTYTYIVKAAHSRYGESPFSEVLTVTVTHPVMATPSNFTSSVTNGNDIQLKWNVVEHATAYNVYQIVDGQKLLQATTTSGTKTFPQMHAGNYTYEVYSYSDRFGESKTGASVSLSLVHPQMEAPTNLTKSILNFNDVKLTWNTALYATAYKIYKVVDGQKTLLDTVTTTTKTYTALPTGTYTYAVHSVSDRFGESAAGSSITVTIDQTSLAAPTNLSQTILNGNDINLRWTGVADAQTYRIYQVIDGQKTLKATVSGTSRTFTNMPAGDYTYEVYSQNDRLGESPTGATLTFTLTHPTLGTPANLKQSVTNGNDVRLSWNEVAYATSYKVYQIINGQKQLKATVSVTSRTFTNMPAGEYQFEVTAVSDRFGEAATGSQITFPLVHPELLAPTNLTKTILNGNDIKLAWTAAEYATSYKIYQVVNGQKVLKDTVATTTKTYTNNPAGTYNYVVHTFSDRFGESATGTALTVTLAVSEADLPAPTALTNKIQEGNDIRLTWTAAINATAYNIYQIIDGQKQLKATVTSTAKTFINMPAGDYTYEVYSFSDRFGESATAAVTSLTLVHPVMETPTNLTQTVANGNDIQLRWGTVPYATSYKVYQIVNGTKQLKATASSGSRTFTNLPAGNYTYEVYSVSDRFGESANGASVSLNLVHPVMEKPAPGNPAYVYPFPDGNDIQLKWTAVNYATSYNIYQVVNGQKVLKGSAFSTSKTYVNMPEGDYTFVIHSVSDRFGESAEGVTISMTLVHPDMQAPANFKLDVQNGNDIVLNWNVASYATEYRLYQNVNGVRTLVWKGGTRNRTYTNLPEGNYRYELTSYSERFGESPVQVVEKQLVHPKMIAPTVTSEITSLSPVTVKLSWNAIPFANKYYVYRIINGEAFLMRSVTTTNTTFNFLAPDRYDFVVTSFSDRFGESPISIPAPVDLYFDTEPPSTGIVGVLPEWLKATAAGVNLEAKDDKSGVAKTFYSIGGAPFVEGTRIALTGEGEHNITFYSVDKSGNVEGHKTATIKVDGTAPVTTATLPADWSAGDVTLTLTATDQLSGVNKTFYSINGGTFVEGTSVDLSEKGITKISYYSVDKAGNQEAGKTIDVKIDKTAPVTTSDVADVWSKDSTAVTLTATDAESGVAKTFYSINGGEFVEGTSFSVTTPGLNTISYYSVDVVGNKEATKTATVKIDGTAPVTASNVEDAWYKEALTVNLTATDAESGVAKTFYSVNGGEFVEGTSFSVSQVGITNISFYSVDVAGNKEAAKTVQVKIDGNPPVTTSDIKNVWNKTAVSVNLTATDAETDVAATFYSINGGAFVEGTSFTVDQEGIHTVSFYSVDAAGNKEEAKTQEVKIDTTAPVTTTDALDTWYDAAVTVALNATDNLSGVEKTFFSVNGGEFVEGTSALVERAGINTISYYSVDVAGNQEATKTVEVKIDGNPPVTTSDATDVWNKEAVTVNLTATDAETDVAKTFYSINGGAYVEGTSFLVTTEGINKISFYSVDVAGNQEEAKTATVKIDTTAPVSTSNAPTTWSKTNVDVKLAATDNLSGVAKTFYSINGGAFVEGTSFTVDKEGINKISFYSVDVAGNKEAAQTVEVKIDKTAPLLSINLGAELPLGSLQLNYLVNENLSGVSTELMVVSGPGTSAGGNKVKNGETINIAQGGQYSVTITVTDLAGNKTTITKNFVVYIPATIEVTPKVIKGNNGVFTVRVDLPQGFSTNGFDLNTATVNGVKALSSNNGYYNQAKNGQFKFERSDFTWNTPEVVLEFRGYVDGQLVKGQTTAKVQK